MTEEPDDPVDSHRSPNAPILSARDVSKSYGGVQALHRVSVDIYAVEVLAVMGENGAGKSTLMKILAGVVRPTSGSLSCQGAPVTLRHVEQALDAGIALIHQELNLVPSIDVGANIALGREPHWFGYLNQRQIRRKAASCLQRLGLDIPTNARLDTLSVGEQQLVEIAKALSIEARVLIMDEPTSSLSQEETQRLYEVVRTLRANGVAIVYISHRLQEVTDLADRVVVLRDGRFAGELQASEIDRNSIIRMMIGRNVEAYETPANDSAEHAVLSVRELRTQAWPAEKLDLELRPGEVVGLAGLIGSGRSELLTTLFGVTPAVGGSMKLAGKPYSPASPEEAIRAGVALAPEDRRVQGLLLQKDIRTNTGLACINSRLQSRGVVVGRRESRLCQEALNDLDITPRHPKAIVGQLSGGNQQKVLLGKWLATEPRVLLLDEPTRGIDVGTKAEIHRLVHDLAAQGVAILFASSDLEEIITLSHRVLVMHDGRIAGALGRSALTEEAIMRLATGHLQEPRTLETC